MFEKDRALGRARAQQESPPTVCGARSLPPSLLPPRRSYTPPGRRTFILTTLPSVGSSRRVSGLPGASAPDEAVGLLLPAMGGASLPMLRGPRGLDTRYLTRLAGRGRTGQGQEEGQKGEESKASLF